MYSSTILILYVPTDLHVLTDWFIDYDYYICLSQ